MEFRPCIDIHNGKVKQIVGGSLRDEHSFARENFVAKQDASYYARLYQHLGIRGGHIILLNKEGTQYFPATREQALGALQAYPGGLQIGGGITVENAADYLKAGADKVVVTSYVFRDGQVDYERLKLLRDTVDRKHLVLDLSCRRTEDGYYIVTDRWQKFTTTKITTETLDFFADYCSEFLIHAVDVEGKANGIEEDLVQLLGTWGKIPITYAGGVHNFADLQRIYELGQNHLHVTIGSALDLFGGNMAIEKVLDFCKSTEKGERA